MCCLSRDAYLTCTCSVLYVWGVWSCRCSSSSSSSSFSNQFICPSLFICVDAYLLFLILTSRRHRHGEKEKSYFASQSKVLDRSTLIWLQIECFSDLLIVPIHMHTWLVKDEHELYVCSWQTHTSHTLNGFKSLWIIGDWTQCNLRSHSEMHVCFALLHFSFRRKLLR